MDCIDIRIPYRQTGYFSKLVLDYIDQSTALQPFYSYKPDIKGIKAAIEARKNFSGERTILVNHLNIQYKNIELSSAVKSNIQALADQNTFTICSAHQPNLFTGPLYFIYKIIHSIKLSTHLKTSLPEYTFIPVFYIGTEDADFEELGHFYLNGQKHEWKTNQKGAFGRMIIDRSLVKIISEISGEVSVLPFGKEIVDLLKKYFKEGETIQHATLGIINALFGEFGLVVLNADASNLKKQMLPIFKDDLLQQIPSSIVAQTCEELGEGYKVQAQPRDVNLFYLDNQLRGRIEKKNGKFYIHDQDRAVSAEEIEEELVTHPENFSPNVILRGLYQETILPNIVFIGGGGEIAYWLQLKQLFDHYKVPMPVLVLRNSFLILEKKWKEKVEKLGLDIDDLFKDEQKLVNEFVANNSERELSLNGTLTQTLNIYKQIKTQAKQVDETLVQHVEALETAAIKKLKELEKKMFRAEKKKFDAQQRQLVQLKNGLFPGGGLQERRENIIYYYAKYGREFVKRLLEHSLALEQEFVVLKEK